MPKERSREALLDAAEEVVLELGGSRMTLEAVAKKAGVSKGCLFYYFATKEALLQAMLIRQAERVANMATDQHAQLPEGPKREIRAYIQGLCGGNRKDKRIGTALLAAIAYDLQLLAPIQDIYRKSIEGIQSPDIRPERTAVISLAVSGLWILELLGISPFDSTQQQQIMQELLRLTED